MTKSNRSLNARIEAMRPGEIEVGYNWAERRSTRCRFVHFVQRWDWQKPIEMHESRPSDSICNYSAKNTAIVTFQLYGWLLFLLLSYYSHLKCNGALPSFLVATDFLNAVELNHSNFPLLSSLMVSAPVGYAGDRASIPFAIKFYYLVK